MSYSHYITAKNKERARELLTKRIGTHSGGIPTDVGEIVLAYVDRQKADYPVEVEVSGHDPAPDSGQIGNVMIKVRAITLE